MIKKLPPIKGRGNRAAPVDAKALPVIEDAKKIIEGEEPDPDATIADSTARTIHKALYESKSKKLIVTSQQHNELLRYIRNGQPPNVAASLVGLPREKFNSWIDLGQWGREPYATLTLNVEHAQAEYFAKLQKVLVQAMLPRGWQKVRNDDGTEGLLPPRYGDPGIAKFLLERQFPELMSEQRKVKVELLNQARALLQKAEAVLDPESFTRLVDSLDGAPTGREGEEDGDQIH